MAKHCITLKRIQIIGPTSSCEERKKVLIFNGIASSFAEQIRYNVVFLYSIILSLTNKRVYTLEILEHFEGGSTQKIETSLFSQISKLRNLLKGGGGERSQKI